MQNISDWPRESKVSQCHLSNSTWKIVLKNNPEGSKEEDVRKIWLWARHSHLSPEKVLVSSRLQRSQAEMQICFSLKSLEKLCHCGSVFKSICSLLGWLRGPWWLCALSWPGEGSRGTEQAADTLPVPHGHCSEQLWASEAQHRN